MNIRQKLSNGVSSIDYYYSCFIAGYCPTSKEREDVDIRGLASRLRAESYEETLTNILEWQNRNVEFWAERHPIQTVLIYVYIASLVALIAGIFGLIFLTVGSIQLLPLLAWFIVVWLAALVSSIATTLAIMISILHSNRKIPWKEIPRGLKNVFLPSISMKWLLEKKLGVCRDYAKLTACLLSNIYPNAEIYFASAPSHVATGIRIENRLYMLDQRLPILTKERWNDYRRPKKRDRVERFDPMKRTLTEDKKTFRDTKNRSVVDTEKLAKKMMELLNIEERPDEEAGSLKVPILWKKGTVLYEDDEMVDYSLARYLKMRISSELIRMDQIRKIGIECCKEDLIFQISYGAAMDSSGNSFNSE